MPMLEIRQRFLFIEMTAFRLEVEHRPAATRGREAKVHRHQLDDVAGRAHDRSQIVDPDVVGLRKIKLALLGRDAKLGGLHHGAI